MGHAEPTIHAEGSYRPDLDGLRSIAIVPVLIYHLDPAWLTGGFLGVDVFFCLSGFLIGTQIALQLEKGTFRLSEFYKRRVLRLMPAFTINLLGTLLGTYLVYNDQDFSGTASTAAFAVLMVANFKLMREGGYFEVQADTSPLLHYWSLAVEEQFYLFFPFLMQLIFRSQRLRRHAIAILVGSLCLSLAGCLWMIRGNPKFAFFMLPTRAWEMLAGAAAALSLLKGRTIFPRFAAPLALLALVVVFFLGSEEYPHPSWQTTVPVLATVVLVLVGPVSAPINRLLSNPALVGIGKLSYSLYLWHWPVYCLVDYALLETSLPSRVALKLLATVVLSTACYQWIETPIRMGPLRHERAWKILTAGMALNLAIAAGGAWLRREFYVDCPVKDLARGGLQFGVDRTGGRVALIGDSHAAMYGRTLHLACERLGLGFLSLGFPARDVLPGSESSNESWDQVLRSLDRFRPDVVVLACAWTKRLPPDPDRAAAAVSQLRDRCPHVVILTEVPALPVRDLRDHIRHGGRPPFFPAPKYDERRRHFNEVIGGLAGDGVTVVDLDPLLLHPDGSILALLAGSHRTLYHDSSHLSGCGAQLVIDAIAPQLASGTRAAGASGTP